MKVINLNNIGEYPDDFVLAKIIIENQLKKDKKIDNKMSISEFIHWLELTRTVYVWNEKFISFRYIKVNEDYEYLFISGDSLNDTIIENITETLKKSNGDIISSRKKITSKEIILDGLGIPKTDYFFIDSEIYI